MRMDYYVVGGEYADTSFTRIAEGREEERYGPFSEHDAHSFWRGITAKTVDNALVRYFIRPADALRGPVFYVVGGEYADTSFTRIAEGRELEIHGPFSRQEALDHWRSITGKTVDSALTRYDITSKDEADLLRKSA